MELLSSRVSLSRECSGKNAGREQMSTIILLCAARGNCSFMSSNSTKVGMSYPLSVQGLLPMDKIKGTGKGKKIQSQQLFATEATQLTNKCNLKHIVLLLRDQQCPAHQFSNLLFLVNTLLTVLETFPKS